MAMYKDVMGALVRVLAADNTTASGLPVLKRNTTTTTAVAQVPPTSQGIEHGHQIYRRSGSGYGSRSRGSWTLGRGVE